MTAKITKLRGGEKLYAALLEATSRNFNFTHEAAKFYSNRALFVYTCIFTSVHNSKKKFVKRVCETNSRDTISSFTFVNAIKTHRNRKVSTTAFTSQHHNLYFLHIYPGYIRGKKEGKKPLIRLKYDPASKSQRFPKRKKKEKNLRGKKSSLILV